MISWVILGIILLVIGLIRFRLLDFPLERDEGGFAYIGRMIQQGVAPYREAYDFKPPGLYLMYALVMSLFGQSAWGIHFGLLVIDLGSVALLYGIARVYMNDAGSLAAALVMGVLQLTSNVLGFAAHATHFVVFWMLIGYLLLLKASRKGGGVLLVLSGLAFGLSAMMKQPGALFILFGLVLLLRQKGSEWRTVVAGSGSFLAGGVIPVAAMLIWLAKSGTLGQFLFWNFTYGSEFGTRIGLSDAFAQFWDSVRRVLSNYEPVWLISLCGMVVSFIRPPLNRGRLHLGLLYITSLVAVSLGFQFRSHYFVMLIPAVSLYCGYAGGWIAEFMRRRMPVGRAGVVGLGVVLLATGYGVFAQRNYFFRDDPVALSRQIYFPNPFAESGEIAAFIRSHTGPGDRVAVLGSEPQILFLAGRESAMPYLFTYFFMEVHPSSLRMQQEAAADIENASPPVIVLVTQPVSWGTRPHSERYIFDWANAYLKKNYKLVGAVDQISPEQSTYCWENDIKSYSRLSEASVLIFKRR